MQIIPVLSIVDYEAKKPLQLSSLGHNLDHAALPLLLKPSIRYAPMIKRHLTQFYHYEGVLLTLLLVPYHLLSSCLAEVELVIK